MPRNDVSTDYNIENLVAIVRSWGIEEEVARENAVKLDAVAGKMGANSTWLLRTISQRPLVNDIKAMCDYGVCDLEEFLRE